MLSVDYRALVSRADLIYHRPVQESVEGQPIGNGEMGTLVWTTPNAIHFQINRSDVFAVNRIHTELQASAIDYGGACAHIKVDLGSDPFRSSEIFEQRLSLYDAEILIAEESVCVRCFISAVSDILLKNFTNSKRCRQNLKKMVS